MSIDERLKDFFADLRDAAAVRARFNGMSDDQRRALMAVLREDEEFAEYIDEATNAFSSEAVISTLALVNPKYFEGKGDGNYDVRVMDEDGEIKTIEVEKRELEFYIDGQKVILREVRPAKDEEEAEAEAEVVGAATDEVTRVIDVATSSEEYFFELLDQRRRMDFCTMKDLIDQKDFKTLFVRFREVEESHYDELYAFQYSNGQEYGTFLHLLLASDVSDDNVLKFLKYVKTQVSEQEFKDYLLLKNDKSQDALGVSGSIQFLSRLKVKEFLQENTRTQGVQVQVQVDTHAASVHKSANKTCLEIFKAFGGAVSGEGVIRRPEGFATKVDELINSADEKFKALQGMTDQQLFEFIKPTLPLFQRQLSLSDEVIQGELRTIRFHIAASLRLFSDVKEKGRLHSDNSLYDVCNDTEYQGVGLTHKEILALSYWGITDVQNLLQNTGNTDVTRILGYAKFLCEIRREYSNGAADVDRSKCAGGTVNHLMNALVGINKLAEIQVITAETMSGYVTKEIKQYVIENISLIIGLIPEDEKKELLLEWKLTNVLPSKMIANIVDLKAGMYSAVRDKIAEEYGFNISEALFEAQLKALPYSKDIDAAIVEMSLNEEINLNIRALSFDTFKAIYDALPTFILLREEGRAYINKAELYWHLSEQKPEDLINNLLNQRPRDLKLILDLLSVLPANDSALELSYWMKAAIDSKNPKVLKRLLAMDIGSASSEANHLLIYSVGKDSLEMVKALLAHPSINPNLQSNGYSPLDLAIEKGNLEMVKALLAHPNIDPNLQSGGLLPLEYGYSPLDVAIKEGNLEMVKALLAHENIDPNLQSGGLLPLEYGYSPLDVAIKEGNLEMVKELLAHDRIDPNLQSNGRSPLDLAIKKGNLEMVKELLAHDRIDPNLQSYGRSPLSLAIGRGDLKMVKALLAHENIDPNLQSYGCSPLDVAIKEGNLEMVKALLANDRIDPNLQSHGRSPLDLAIKKGNLEMVKELLAHENIDPNLQSYGYSPLYPAIIQGDFSVIFALVRNKNISVENMVKGYAYMPPLALYCLAKCAVCSVYNSVMEDVSALQKADNLVDAAVVCCRYIFKVHSCVFMLDFALGSAVNYVFAGANYSPMICQVANSIYNVVEPLVEKYLPIAAGMSL